MLWVARRNSFSFGCEKRIFRAVLKEKVGIGEGERERESHTQAPHGYLRISPGNHRAIFELLLLIIRNPISHFNQHLLNFLRSADCSGTQNIPGLDTFHAQSAMRATVE